MLGVNNAIDIVDAIYAIKSIFIFYLERLLGLVATNNIKVKATYVLYV